MNLNRVEQAEDTGVLVVSAWREGPGRPLALRVIASLGDEPETLMVTGSAEEVETVVQRWLLQFAEVPRLLGRVSSRDAGEALRG